MVPEPSPPFEISVRGEVTDYMRALLGRAAAAGIHASVSKEITVINDRLLGDPRNFGEITHDLRILQLENFLATQNGIRVVFAVHKRIPIVFVNNVRLLPSHPLYDPAKDD